MKGSRRKSYRRSGNIILFTWHAFFPQNVYDHSKSITTEDFLETQRRGYTERCLHCSSELQKGNNSFREQHPGRSWRWATRTTEKLKRSVVSSLEKKKKRRKRPRLEEGTSGLKREDIMFQIRHFYLQPKWWIPAKVKIPKKERKSNPN